VGGGGLYKEDYFDIHVSSDTELSFWHADRCDQLSSALSSLEGPGFKSWPGDWVFKIGIYSFFSVAPGRCWVGKRMCCSCISCPVQCSIASLNKLQFKISAITLTQELTRSNFMYIYIYI
jgi:hypothetical protein